MDGPSSRGTEASTWIAVHPPVSFFQRDAEKEPADDGGGSDGHADVAAGAGAGDNDPHDKDHQANNNHHQTITIIWALWWCW